jgi:hypothetical protein
VTGKDGRAGGRSLLEPHGPVEGLRAEAYNNDAELYPFLKTLEAYKGIVNENTDVVLSTNSPLLRFLRAER